MDSFDYPPPEGDCRGASAIGGLRDSTYSALVVSSVASTNSTIVWTMELTTSWAACSAGMLVTALRPGLCQGDRRRDHSRQLVPGGGVDISLTGDGRRPSSFHGTRRLTQRRSC